MSPVERSAPGARTLVEVVGGDVRWPALVVSGGERGRAVWAGGLLDIDWSVYRSDYGIERFYRDVRLFRIYEGSSQIQQLIIARETLKDYTPN